MRYATNKRNAQFSKLIFSFKFLSSPTCFEPLEFILKEAAVYVIWDVLHASVLAVWWVGECVRDSPTHQTANTDARKTSHAAYTAVSLRMNPRVSKDVGDNRN